MKKILVTGASGFVGKSFIDMYKTNFGIKKFSFLKDDFDSLDLSNIDTVLHLSALVHQKNYLEKELYEKVNVTQSIDLAKKAKADGVKQFIFMSTIAVYGLETGVVSENTICNPQTEYAKTKFTAEQGLQMLADENFKVVILRVPLIYGKNGVGNVKKLRYLVKKYPILPFANTNNKRSMIDIVNLCNTMNEIIKNEKFGMFILSNNEVISTTDLVKLIAKDLDKKVYLINIPFLKSVLKFLKPSFYKKIYCDLIIDIN